MGKAKSPTLESEGIRKITGINFEAVEKLAHLKNKFHDELMSILICHDSFENLLDRIQQLAQNHADIHAINYETGKPREKRKRIENHHEKVSQYFLMLDVHRYKASKFADVIIEDVALMGTPYWLKASYRINAKYNYEKNRFETREADYAKT